MLSPKQKATAHLLASGATGRAVAEALGINVNTVSRWRKLPAFRVYLGHLLKEVEDEAVEHLHALRARAVERIAALLGSQNEVISLRAAEAVLDRTAAGFPSASHPEADDGADFRRFVQSFTKHLDARRRYDS